MCEANRLSDSLSAFEFDISNADVGAQFILAVAVVLERLAQPATTFAVAFAIDVSDASARVNEAVARVFGGNADIADSQVHVFVAFNAVDGQIADFLMDIEMSVGRNFQFYVELCVPAAGSVELNSGIVSPNIEVRMRVLHAAFPVRLHRVLQPDSCGIPALDVQVANVETHMHVASGNELSGICVALFIAPVTCRAERNKKKTKQNRLVDLPGLKR